MYRLSQEIEDAIYDWAVSCLGSGVNIIWDKPDEDRPEKPYCTLNILSGPFNVNTRA